MLFIPALPLENGTDMKKIFLALIVCLSAVLPSFSEKTPVKSLFHYKLENGLSLFVAENHSVPLSYIEIAVRCGSYTQNEKNAGLFHLYEHMMFKGNSLYRDAASVNRALSDMGVSDWNGTTGLECVNYYFTVPSDMTEKGLEFWSYAIRKPLMNRTEFEAEKKVVISEINGSASDPSRILMEARNELIFSDAPYAMSPSGSEDSVKNATLKQLKEIQRTFYVPNNSAVFVGGDVVPDEVYEMVKRTFGSWKKGKNPFADGMIKHSKEPFGNPVYCVMPYEKISGQLAQIMVEFRGPDAAYDLDDTYPVDVLLNLIENPLGIFKKSLVDDKMLGVPDSGYAGGGYQTRKTCGILSFYALVTQPELDVAERAKYFAAKIPGLVEKTAAEAEQEQIRKICERLDDDNIITRQTAEGLLGTLRFWWSVSGEDYYYTYNQKIADVTSGLLVEFSEKYLKGKNPLVTVLVSPAVYEKTKNQFEKAGFEEIKK